MNLSPRYLLGSAKLYLYYRWWRGVERWLRIWQGQEQHIRRDMRCRTQRLGSAYGGWTFCPDKLDRQALVYSVGIGQDISFDLALIRKYGMTIYGFDPTPSSLAWLERQNLPPQFRYFPYALATEDREIQLFVPEAGNSSFSILQRNPEDGNSVTVPARRLTTLMQMLGHAHIDLLKIDIEGAEYDVLEEIVASSASIGQLLIEFHHRYPEVGFDATAGAVKLLRAHGFLLFAVAPNGEEYSFIRQGEAGTTSR
jgi:FkbM family methyltransferase